MSLSQNLNDIHHAMKQAEEEAHRPPKSVMLLAVSKQQSAIKIIEAYRLGITHFGENYLQEALSKMDELQHLPLCWHFLGPIQSNKTKAIANHFDWVHSVNRIKIAELLSKHRPPNQAPLNVCLQINLVAEETKSGISPHEAMGLAMAVSQLPYLKLRGLMTIPLPKINDEAQYHLFTRLNHLMHEINKQAGLSMDTLSMGMSDDFIPAIKAGATLIRIGQALFGQREKTL